MSTHPSLYVFQSISALLYALTIMGTSFRLYLRAKVRIWWWDDSVAVLATLSMSLFIVGGRLLTTLDGEAMDARYVYYPLMFGYYLPIWFSRFSILYTTIRFAPLVTQRKALRYIAGAVFLQCAFLICEATFYFELEGPTHMGYQPSAMCISQVLTTILADVLLIASPIVILRNSHLEPGIYIRLVAIVSISAVATAFAVIHVVIALTVGGLWAALFGMIEIFVAISVCNLYVIFLTVIVRRIRGDASAVANGTTISTVITEQNATNYDAVWFVENTALQDVASVSKS